MQVGNARYSAVDGVLFSKNGDTLVCFPAGRGGENAMPAGVMVVGDYAFAACSKLTAVTICPGIERVGAWAFSNCGGLESLNLPYGLRYIGDKALYKSDALASIYIPSTVEHMGEKAIFQYGKLVDVYWLADAEVAAGIGPTIKEGKGSNLYVRKGEKGKFLGDEFFSFKRIEWHLVSFVGENDLLLDEQLVKPDGTAQASLQPARNGYAFEGWFEDGASAAYDFSVPPTGDLKLKGRWRDEGATKYAVTFVAEGDDGQLLEEATVAIAADGWASGVYVVRVGARDGARALRVVKGEGSRFGALGAREGAWSPGVREFVEICIPLQQ